MAAVAVLVFIVASIPWFVLRLKALRVWQRLVTAVILVFPCIVLPGVLGVARGYTGGAIAISVGLNFGVLGWHWNCQITDDILRRKHSGLETLLTPKLPFMGRRGVLFMIVYRTRMARDATSQEWLRQRSSSRWSLNG